MEKLQEKGKIFSVPVFYLLANNFEIISRQFEIDGHQFQKSLHADSSILSKILGIVTDEMGLCLYLLETLTDRLAGSEDVYLHLLLGNVENGGDVLVAFSLDFTQLYAAALLFGQLVDELPYQLDAVALHCLCLRIGMVAVVRRLRLVVERERLRDCMAGLVDGKVATDGEAEYLDVFDGVPCVTPTPYLQHRFLHHVLRLRRIERNAEGKPEKPVL